MRQYYASDKKKREEAKKKHREEKRLKKMNKSEAKATATEIQPATEVVSPNVETGLPASDSKR